jgi:hypothetical protein
MKRADGRMERTADSKRRVKSKVRQVETGPCSRKRDASRSAQARARRHDVSDMSASLVLSQKRHPADREWRALSASHLVNDAPQRGIALKAP